jgi:hypothetical protein
MSISNALGDTTSLRAAKQIRYLHIANCGDFHASNFRSTAFLAVAAPNKTNTVFEGDSHYSS